MAKNGPKFSKRALSAVRNQAAAVQNEPVTAEEFLEEGVTSEDSGDRWYGSDLAKALRFYQKAFEQYQQAIQLGANDAAIVRMAHYNASRLLFNVYTQYRRAEGVDVFSIENIHDVIRQHDTSVVQPIQRIGIAHENAIDAAGADVPIDLLFNAALVCIDAIDETDSTGEVLELATAAAGHLREALQRQLIEANLFFTGTDSPDIDDPDTPASPASPEDIIDSVVTIYNLTHVVLEAVREDPQWAESAVELLGPLNEDAENTTIEVIRRYSHVQGPGSLTGEVRNELEIAKAYAVAASLDNLTEYFEIWDSVSLPKTPERFMQAADCIDSFLHSTIIGQDPTYNPQEYWDGLCKMNVYLKAADELLQERLRGTNSSTGPSQSQGSGTVIAQICSIYIARADLDLQRSQLPYEAAIKSQTILANNAKAFLKNAMNFAKKSGGLRETAAEKARREKRRIEAVSRLCVLEGKTTRADFDAIVGEGRWAADVESYIEQWYMPIDRVL